MSGIKKLAGQTMWYGVSTIAARFLNYLVTPYLTNVLLSEDYGKMSLVYSVLPFLNVLFTYGLETAFFRFSNKEENKATIYNTTATSIIISTVLLGATLLFFHQQLATFAGIANYPELIKLSIIIIMIDTLAVIPFAKLRYDGRPRKYAMAKVSGIVAYLFFTFFFLSVCYVRAKANPASVWNSIVDVNKNPVYYIVVANLIQAVITLLFLYREVLAIRFKIDLKLWRQIMVYSMPMIIVGMGGVINETLDRIMLKWWVPGTEIFKEQQVAIYSACYKLSILISLFIQAFRMGAEPFFFKQAGQPASRRKSARPRASHSMQAVLTEAVALLDEAGDSALTFRALAERLGGGVASIYWYVSNKDELLDRATDHVLEGVLADVALLAATDDPIDDLRSVALTLFDAIVDRPWLGAYFMRNTALQSSGLKMYDRLGREVLRLQGLTPLQQFHAVSAVIGFVVGTAADLGQEPPREVLEGTVGRKEYLERFADQWRALDPEEFPFVTHVVEEFSGHDDTVQFRAGLDLLLAGLRLQAGD